MNRAPIPGGAAPDTGRPAGSGGARLLRSGPDASQPVPEPLRRRFGDGIEEIVWVNEVGGVTVRALAGGASVYAKWAPPGSELDLAAETAAIPIIRRES